jgi:hypothetical protein
MFFQPSLRLLAQIIARRTQVILREVVAAAVKQECGNATPRLRRSAQRNGVEMHALEMTRSFVLLGIADRTEGMLGFQ